MTESDTKTNRVDRADAIALLFAILLAVYHFHLLGRGALAWPDEFLYRDAWGGVRALQQGDVREFAKSITGFGARPIEALLRLPGAWTQLWLEDHRGLPRMSADSLRIAASLNVITSFLLMIVFYRVSRRLFACRWCALLATVVYALLVSNNIWVRHILPYDTGMLLGLTALLLILRVPVERSGFADIALCLRSLWLPGVLVLAYPLAFFRMRSIAIPLTIAIVAALAWAAFVLMRSRDRAVARAAAVAGAVAACGVAVYPAYYSLPAALGGLLLIGALGDRWIDLQNLQIRAVALYGTCAAIVMFAFELFARIGNVSYLGSAARLSGTIALGNFDEGYVFLPKYFLWVEGLSGFLVVALAAAYLVILVARRSVLRGAELLVARAVVLVGACYLVYATQSTVMHKMAFTERYARMYMPFLIWAAISAIAMIPTAMIRRPVAILCAAVSLLSFVQFAREYERVGYPFDALRALRIGYEDVVPEHRIDEMPIYQNYNLPVKSMVSAPEWVTHPGDERFVLVNFGWALAGSPRRVQYAPPSGAALIYDATNFTAFRSGPFEGWMPAQREEFRRRPYRLKVYRLPEAPLAPPPSAPRGPAGSK